MRLGEIVMDNEKKGADEKNDRLVRIRLRELVFAYPKEVSIALKKTGVGETEKLPKEVLYSVVIKHLHRNPPLRDAIAKMLLEMDGYHSFNGWTGIVGGALSAVGSVLTGIGQGQFQNSDQQRELQLRQMEIERQRRAEEVRQRNRNWFIFGLAVLGLVGTILVIRTIQKNKLQQVKPVVA